MPRLTPLLTVLMFLGAARAAAQSSMPSEADARQVSGPRVGLTVIPPALVRRIESDLKRSNVFPVISQFGWQTETDVASNDKGGAAVVEAILLVGGIEQGMFLPSLTGLIGFRGSHGGEFGLGPNLTLTGVGLAVGAGVTTHSGSLNIPMNVAVATGAGGIRVTFLTGFNWRKGK